MKRKITAYLLLIAVLFQLSACTSSNPTASTPEEANTSAAATDTKATTQEATKTLVSQPNDNTSTSENEIDFKKNVVPASEYFHIKKINTEENARDFTFWSMMSENKIATTQALNENKTACSVGIYHIQDNRYEELYSYTDRFAFIHAANSDYFILLTTADRGESYEMQSLNLKTKTVTVLPKIKAQNGDLYEMDNVLLDAHTLYFNLIDRHENGTKGLSELYAYDLDSDKITFLKAEMNHPKLANGEIVAIVQGHVEDLHGKTLLNLPKGVSTFESTNQSGLIFAMQKTEKESLKLSSTTLLNLTKNDVIFTSDATFGSESVSENLVSWHTFFNTKPQLYLIDKDIVVSFDDLPEAPGRFLLYGKYAFFIREGSDGYEYYYVEPTATYVDRTLSLDELIRLASKGSDLNWGDFESYSYTETGSGLYIRVYDINPSYSLWIGGGSTEEKPMYIRLVSKKDESRYIDIRENSVEAFIR